METYSVVWVDSAKNELFEIIEYIAIENQLNAKNIYKNIKRKADSLSMLPYKGRIVPEFQQFEINLYREIIESPWRIIYRIHEKRVVIMTILDGRRDVEDIIFQKIISFNGKTFV
jgi:plasmid stabilization system protein ParE